MSHQTLARLAKAYGIRIVRMPKFHIPDAYRGPTGHGCDPIRKKVFIATDIGSRYETIIHELVHVIVQPPWAQWTIKSTPEEFILMQFERCLARAFFDMEIVDSVKAWQEETGLFIVGDREYPMRLGDFDRYWQTHFWRHGFALCRTLGLIDHQNRPTLKMPKWGRLRSQEKSLAAYYRLPWTISEPNLLPWSYDPD